MWDLGLKVGHSSRSLDEMVRMAKADLTIRTAILEGRYLWGDQALYERGQPPLLERGRRPAPRRSSSPRSSPSATRATSGMGDSRYVVEPNVKDGKGGLRDLQTLYWIGKYIHRVRDPAELVDVGLFTPSEYRSFRRAESFLLAVRCHLHTITRRAEDRLTFDLQREVARRMNFADRPGKSAVERFMQYYFLQAQTRRQPDRRVPRPYRRADGAQAPPARAAGRASAAGRACSRATRSSAGRICAPSDDWFRQDPVRLLEVFQIAEEEGLEIHPETMRMARRDAELIKDEVRRDPRANALFLKLLTGRRDPETVLRWMNEAGVFGRFVPDFGKVNAQMQFDMYHHYTVDEHTIRAIGLLAQIERGELKEDHPLATELLPQHRQPQRALRRDAAARHRQGPRRRPLGARRRSGDEAVPAARA